MGSAADEMDARNGAQVLSERGWLSRMPADFRQAVLKRCVYQRHEAKASLFLAGDAPGGIFGIVDGFAGGIASRGRADAPFTHIGGPGLWFGEGPILTGEARRMSVFAITAALIAHVPLAALHALLAERPEWWQRIGHLAIETSDIVASGLVDLTIRDNGQRCAAILLRLCDCRFTDDDAKLTKEVMLTQAEFAAMANLSRDSVNTILRQLTKRRLIELRYGSIVVIETEILRKIASGE